MFNRESRYFETQRINFDGVHTVGSFEVPSWLSNLKNNQLLSLSVPSDLEGRPDVISQALYGTPRLYWVLIWINQPFQPFGWPRAGSVIRYPIAEVVRSRA